MKKRFLHNKGVILLTFFTIFSMSCQQLDRDYSIAGFDEVKWKTDSLGCSGVRRKMVDSLYKHWQKFDGLSKDSFESHLGKPDLMTCSEKNGIKYNSYYYCYYFVEPGIQCRNSKWKENGYTSAMQIAFIITENKVVGTAGIIYP